MVLNKIITSVNALVNDVTIPTDQINNVVCIDTQRNRIGVKTASPSEEIDISGTLKTNYIYFLCSIFYNPVDPIPPSFLSVFSISSVNVTL